jgi:thiol-disulfide isomerase/thioredoxin
MGGQGKVGAIAFALAMGMVVLSALVLSARPLMGTVPGRGPAAAAAAGGAGEAEKAPIYDEKADGREQVKGAVARAKKDNKHVLIQWGGNWCGWCVALHAMFEKDPEIRKVLSYEYELVLIDTNERNQPLAKELGAALAGVPYLTVLDGNGKAIAQQETGALEVKDAAGKSVGTSAGHDPAKVLAFLKTHAPKALKADEVLAKGLGEAKASGRMVFLHFGAPWCGWCKRLEAWMDQPAIAAILAKDFVDVKIDTERMEGGKQMATKFGATGGIPWYAFVDGEGKTLVHSASAGSNIGYPGAPEEIAGFEGMVKRVAKKISAAEVGTLTGSLKEEAKKLGR